MAQENPTNWKEKLKTKWKIESDFRFWKVFIGFAITGTSSAFVTKPMRAWIFEQFDLAIWQQIGVRILLVLVVYQILLLVVGAILGEFAFFYGFEKKMWLSLGKLFKTKQPRG